MTRRSVHDLGCVCGRHFRRALYHALDVTQQPGLRYAVLARVLNAVQCPSCERMARVDLPFLYNDAAKGQLIYVYPAEAEGEAHALEGQIVQVIGALQRGMPALEGLPRPTVMFGLDRLAELIAGGLSDEERPGSIHLDVRPGIRSERAGRLLAGRLAVQADGYVHSWREGGRLHLQILGPSGRLEAIALAGDEP